MRTRIFNPQIFLECICFCVFGGTTLYLAVSGKYLSYVTPRMEPYLFFTAAVMLIWVCASLSRLFLPQYKVRTSHCFILAIPVLLILLPHSPLNASEFTGGYIGGNAFTSQAHKSSTPQKQTVSDNSEQPDIIISASTEAETDIDALTESETNIVTDAATDNTTENTTEPSDTSSNINDNNTITDNTTSQNSTETAIPNNTADVPEDYYSSNLPGLDEVNRKITVSNDDFAKWFTEIYINMKKYEGYTVVVTGFVFKDSNLFTEDEFSPARLMMSCCVADLEPIGFILKYDKYSELEDNSWVTVEGTLFIGEYEYDGNKYDDPQLKVTKITTAEPVEGYVYP